MKDYTFPIILIPRHKVLILLKNFISKNVLYLHGTVLNRKIKLYTLILRKNIY